MNSLVTLTMPGGVRIVVPDSLDRITPYVLREQQDWFEDEIKFVRRLLRPGDKAIDIGANYGVYALSMAHAVGPSGRVWAFEPASATASLLARSIEVNGFSHTVLEQRAVSAAAGTARLSLNENPELNSLVPGEASSSAAETVAVVTLDDCIESHGWGAIEFMKMDAEGEEANILKGGRRFFSIMSPLVQYEVRAGADLHVELVRAFSALGYDSYRLVPGLDVLVAFDPESPPDAYLLNLFCCRQDRAERLAERGLLVAPAPGRANDAETARPLGAYDWRQTIARLPYGEQLADRWESTVAAGGSVEVEAALSRYAASRDPSLPAARRFAELESSFHLLKALCDRDPSRLRLASLARVARDYGARAIAVDALKEVLAALRREGRADPGEPFLAPGVRFESLPPGPFIDNWLLAAVLEESERLGSFSSFYTGAAALQRLEVIRTLGFGSAEMERRLRLVGERFATRQA